VGINHDQGTPHNPWQPTPFAPGGSSSGSGVAVAAGLVPVALGTDTGGSVRIPAALCGIVGLKTTVGRISRTGVYPLSGTLDSVGVLSRTVEDAALVFQALQGKDRRDSTTLMAESPYSLESLRQGVRGLRIALCETAFFDDVDPEVEAAVRATAEVFTSLGARVERIEVSEVAEAAADPLRPLLLAVESSAINAEYLDHHLEALDPVIAPRMLEGRKVTAPDYYALLQRRTRLVERTQWTLREVDALLVPTSTPRPGRHRPGFGLPTTTPATTTSGWELQPVRSVGSLRVHAARPPDRLDDLCPAVPGRPGAAGGFRL
jgi:aspartyl-tRNA(Asn)/glutamyl-tRNA(Gln) amidotransferase subunit A